MPSVTVTIENQSHNLQINGSHKQTKYLDGIPAAIIVNKFLWYSIRLVYYDSRSGQFLVMKLTEVWKKDIESTIHNITQILRSQYPFKLLQRTYKKYVKEQLPPTLKITIDIRYPFSTLQRGDVVIAKRYRAYGAIQYDHYGIYIGNERVIQWNGHRANGSDASIREEDWTEFAGDSHDIKALYTPLDIESIDNRIALAQQYTNIDNAQYNLFSNNCEHFAREMLYGRSHSTQIEELLTTVKKVGTAVGGALLVVGVGIVAFGGRASDGDEKKKDNNNEGDEKKEIE